MPQPDDRDVAADLKILDAAADARRANAAEIAEIESMRRAVALLGRSLSASCGGRVRAVPGCCSIHAGDWAALREYRAAIARLGGSR